MATLFSNGLPQQPKTQSTCVWSSFVPEWDQPISLLMSSIMNNMGDILSSSEVLESCNNGYGNYGGEIPLTVLVELIIDE